MKTWIEKIVGINWRTSLTGLLETIVVMTAAYNALPDSVRKNPWIVAGAIAAAVLKTLKESQIKDKQVAGTPGTGFVVAPGPEKDVRAIDTKEPPRL